MEFKYEINQRERIGWHLQFAIPICIFAILTFFAWQILVILIPLLSFYMANIFLKYDSVYLGDNKKMIFSRKVLFLKKEVKYDFDDLFLIERIQVWIYFVFKTKRIKMQLDNDIYKNGIDSFFSELVMERKKNAHIEEIKIRGF